VTAGGALKPPAPRPPAADSDPRPVPAAFPGLSSPDPPGAWPCAGCGPDSGCRGSNMCAILPDLTDTTPQHAVTAWTTRHPSLTVKLRTTSIKKMGPQLHSQRKKGLTRPGEPEERRQRLLHVRHGSEGLVRYLDGRRATTVSVYREAEVTSLHGDPVPAHSSSRVSRPAPA
jgi:hypothetical protein